MLYLLASQGETLTTPQTPQFSSAFCVAFEVRLYQSGGPLQGALVKRRPYPLSSFFARLCVLVTLFVAA
jgi:hypothetical protein